MKIIKNRIERGSLAERIVPEVLRKGIIKTCEELSKCLEKNKPFD